MSPLEKVGGAFGIPDLYAKNTLKMLHKQTYTILPDSNGNIVAALLPTLPGSLNVLTGAIDFSSVINDVVSISNTPAADTAAWNNVPFQQYVDINAAALPTGPATYTYNTNPYGVVSARVTTMAVKVENLAEELVARGQILVNRIPIRLGDESVVGTFENNIGGTATTGSYWQHTMYQIPRTFAAAQGTQEYTVGPAVKGCYAVATKDGPEWDMVQWGPKNFNKTPTTGTGIALTNVYGYVPVDDDEGITDPPSVAVITVPLKPTNSNLDYAPINFLDKSWSGLGLYLSGLAPPTATPEYAGQPMQFEVIMGVEYELRSDSPYGDFTTPSPKNDPGALRLVSDIQSKAPIAVPACDNPSGVYWDILKGIAVASVKAARMAARSRIPGISEIGLGISAVADQYSFYDNV